MHVTIILIYDLPFLSSVLFNSTPSTFICMSIFSMHSRRPLDRFGFIRLVTVVRDASTTLTRHNHLDSKISKLTSRVREVRMYVLSIGSSWLPYS